MKDYIEGLAAQGLALIEQCAWPRANACIGSQVGCGRDQIGQHKLGEWVARKMSAVQESARQPGSQKSRSTSDKHLHGVQVTIVVRP